MKRSLVFMLLGLCVAAGATSFYISKKYQVAVDLSRGNATETSVPSSLDIRTYPTLMVKNYPITVQVKNPSGSYANMVFVIVFDANHNEVMRVELFNDGQHGDVNANDYVVGNTFTIASAGTYTIKPCVGESVNSCAVVVNSQATVDIQDMSCEPLFPNHNVATADRINIIMIGANYDSMDQFFNISRRLIGIDRNPIPIWTQNQYGNNYIYRYDWPLFSIEPFKSNLNKFNFWYLSTMIRGNVDEFREKITSIVNGTTAYLPFCNLRYVYPAFISNGRFNPDNLNPTDDSIPHASLPNQWPFKDDGTINKGALSFGASLNAYQINLRGDESDTPSDTLVHETGHALFGLSDEYNLNYPNTHFPNCAPDLATAHQRWGDLENSIDPFYYEYKRVLEQSNLEPQPESSFRVGFFHGGCGLDDNSYQTYRSTNESIMRSSIISPVFGSVNRRWMERVLGLFSGTSATPTPTATPKPGDVNHDGVVNIFDYNAIVAAFGQSGSGLPADLDGNGRVDIFDYNIVVGHFGT